MGVIKKMLYRSNMLGKQRHQHFFLDMEENIHIHYRDLRIELSRGEFEDICEAFRKQSQELQTIIDEKNYQDGKLPNANQDDVRIWTESLLKHDVKYHPQRFSLEECSDGFHFHCRNYKLLFNEAEFRQIAQLFKNLVVDSPCARTYDEVLALLEDNDVDFTMDAGNIPGEILAIAVAPYHFPKIREIFKLIGFTLDAQKYEHRYQGASLKVIAKVNTQQSTLDYKRIRGNKSTERLVDFLSRNASTINPDELNRIKCQVLDLYFALSSGKALNVDINQQSWLYSSANQQVIFPYSASSQGGKSEAATLYKTWGDFLVGLKLWFVKPTKRNLPPLEQEALLKQVRDTLHDEVAAYPAVDKIYLMGSALRGEMGRYLAPFVNGPQVKLGSDVDILIEINPAHEADIPAHWHLIKQNEASNQCAIYHITQIPIAGGIAEWRKHYPHLPLIEHLIDAYVFFPSREHSAEKDAFLKKFESELFYDRARDGIINRSGEESNIAQRVSELYPLPNVSIEKLNVATENALYRVSSGTLRYVLKLFKVSGNYKRNRVEEHTAYEGKLISLLKERGIHTPGVIPSTPEQVQIEGFPALLFEYLDGEPQLQPEYPLDKTCAALADIHQVQLDQALNLSKNFTFEDICTLWLPLFKEYLNNTGNSPEIAAALQQFAPSLERFATRKNRDALYADIPFTHNHGDVTPKNVMTDKLGLSIFFDFNNAYFGPRIADVLDGAFEFSLAEQYIHLADFARFDAFIAAYSARSQLNAKELKKLEQWIELIGLVKFTREVRALLEHPGDDLRKKRALAIAGFVNSRSTH